mmetsp:Transcript_65086/g.142707  ORF Transcript_65086/g.142707 Transcript_65086/m.142707 type:complete len:200 (+) Transcript_65086:1129-1728(+)
MIGIMGQQQEFLIVTLFRLERVFNGTELVIETDPFILQTLHDSLIGLPNALSLVVFDHHLVQTIFQNPDLPHFWRRFVGVHLGTHRQLVFFDVQLIQKATPLVVLVFDHVKSPLHLLNLITGRIQDFLQGLWFLISQLCDLISEHLVFILHLTDDFLVLLNIQFGGLIGRLPFSFQQLESPLQIFQLLFRTHGRFGHRT